MRSNDFLQSDWRGEEKVHQITPEKREEGKEEQLIRVVHRGHGLMLGWEGSVGYLVQ